MKIASQTAFRYKWLLLFGILTIIIVLAISSMIRANSWILLTPVPTPDPFATYDPAAYGIPDMIAGYKVLAVKTLQNTACMMPNAIRLLLQSSQQDVENFLENSESQIINNEIEKIELILSSKLEIEYLGPGVWDKDLFILRNDLWNKEMKNGGCTLVGGPAQAITPAK